MHLDVYNSWCLGLEACYCVELLAIVARMQALAKSTCPTINLVIKLYLQAPYNRIQYEFDRILHEFAWALSKFGGSGKFIELRKRALGIQGES